MSDEKKTTAKTIIGFIEKIFRDSEEKDNVSREYLNHLVRLKAEFENYKKRAEKEKQGYVKFANEQLILQVLPVFDTLRLALDSVRLSGSAELVQGMEMIFKSLEEVLLKNGLSKIETEGKVFDPHMHEAVEFLESDEIVENTVIGEVKEGYTINGKVLRPARVKISRKPNKEIKTD
jgi:molecular chaperone GrpE